MGAQSPPVDQGQGPGNSLAHHVGAEVHEVAVYLQLRWREDEVIITDKTSSTSFTWSLSVSADTYCIQSMAFTEQYS